MSNTSHPQTMSVVGCILIAVIAQRWKPALIAAVVVGLLGSTLFGLLHWQDMHYGVPPTFGYMGFYVAIGTAAFVAETMAIFGIKIGVKALLARRRSGRTQQSVVAATSTEVAQPARAVTPIQVPQTRRVRDSRTIVVSATVAAVLLAVAVAASIQPLRDHLRKRYGFESSEYYDRLPADTDANRALVVQLLADRDRDKAAMNKALTPQTPPETHGRTSSLGRFIITAPPPEPEESLAWGYEIERASCHLDWGFLDRTFDLCRSVDQSAVAAEHYANDVEAYWIPRLRPTPLIPPSGSR